jgi:hypothetical protein
LMRCTFQFIGELSQIGGDEQDGSSHFLLVHLSQNKGT